MRFRGALAEQISIQFPLDFHPFSMVFHWFSYVFLTDLRDSMDLQWISFVFHRDSSDIHRVSCYFDWLLMVLGGVPHDFHRLFTSCSYVFDVFLMIFD